MLDRAMIAAVVFGCAGGVAGAPEGVESVLCRASVVGEVAIADAPDDLLVDGDFMYALSGDVLRVYDVGDAVEPTLAGTYVMGASASRIGLSGGRLFVVGSSSIQVFDAGDPLGLVELNAIDIAYGGSLDVRFVGARVFVADEWQGLRSFDFSDVMSPVMAQVPAFNPGTGSGFVELVGGFVVYGNSYHTARVFDYSDPASLDVVGDFDLFMQPRESASDGSYLFRLGVDEQTLDEGFLVYDVSDPLSPVLVSSVLVGGAELEYFSEQGIVLSKRDHAIELIDVRDPIDPALLGSVTPGTSTRESAIVGGYLYLALGDRLEVIDMGLIGDPVLGGVATASSAVRFELLGDYAYVLDSFSNVEGLGGISVIDVSDPLDLQHRGSARFAGYTLDLAVDWPYVYAANDFNGVSIVDVRDPDGVVLLSETSLVGDHLGLALDVAVLGDVAYVANRTRLVVLDVSDRGAPWVIDEIDVPALGVHVHEGVLLVSSDDDALIAYGLDDPRAPERMVSLNDFGYRFDYSAGDHPSRFVVDGDRLSVSGSYGHLLEFELDLPGSIGFVREHLTSWRSTGFALDDGLLYGVGDSEGFVYEARPDGSLAPLGAFTNREWMGDIAVRGDYAFFLGRLRGQDASGLGVVDLRTSCSVCLADLNGDGVLSYFDAAALMAGYQAGDMSVDLNGDGSIDFHDVAEFLDSYGDGCP